MKINILFFIGIVFLSSCNNIDLTVQKVPGEEMSDWGNFSILSPVEFKEHITRDDGSIALTTYDTNTTRRIDSDFSVWLYPNQGTTCDLKTHGISGCAKDGELIDSYVETGECRHLSNGAIWGEADFASPAHANDPNYPELIKTIKCGGKIPVMCAEKDGKAVVICINQEKKDLKTAEQIFSTFRWTE
jgi:hypothetical protein